MCIYMSNTKVNDLKDIYQEKQSKRSPVITSQYILKVMKRFIDIVKLELKRWMNASSIILILTVMLNRSCNTISKKPYQSRQLQWYGFCFLMKFHFWKRPPIYSVRFLIPRFEVSQIVFVLPLHTSRVYTIKLSYNCCITSSTAYRVVLQSQQTQ